MTGWERDSLYIYLRALIFKIINVDIILSIGALWPVDARGLNYLGMLNELSYTIRI